MTIDELIYTFLRERSPAVVCDDCLGEGIASTRHELVRPIARLLGLRIDFRRALGVCSICRYDKFVTHVLEPAAPANVLHAGIDDKF
jgi:hypothetical protein